WVASWLTDSPTSSETDSNSGQVTTENTNATTPNTPKKQTNGSLNGINVFLDPGHGGSDPGSFGINNEQEKDLHYVQQKRLHKAYEMLEPMFLSLVQEMNTFH